MEKICWQITVAAFMQPLQDDLRDPAAKDNSITNAATARSNLDAAITMRSAETELQNTLELRATASEIVAPKPEDLDARAKKKIFWNTLEFCRPHMHEKQLKPHLQCGTDPSMIRPWSEHDPPMIRPHTRPSRNRRTAEVDHRGSGTDFVWKNIGFRASAISQKRISCETSFKTPSETPPPAPLAMPFALRERSYSCKSQWNSIGNSSTSTTCNPIYIAGTILQLQITMEFCRPHVHEKQLKPHLQCGTDPSMIRPWSEHDPTTHETVSQPSHRRGRSSRFGDGLCMEKHRVSCICYLSKTHFVRDFLQNSIGNSSTSTTCNAICIAGTILQLQITMEFHRQLIHQHHLQSHLHCGNDPTVANHNGILSTAHARKTVETPFTMRNLSEHDPTMIRTWSAHVPTTHETVSQPSHRRGRSSRFGDGLCMEKHRASCICYLSKTHFVRDFLQNSIGNSSTSTTCNAILTLSLTNSFPDILKVTINSVPN